MSNGTRHYTWTIVEDADKVFVGIGEAKEVPYYRVLRASNRVAKPTPKLVLGTYRKEEAEAFIVKRQNQQDGHVR